MQLLHIVQGLPSAYLAPNSFLTDATDQSSLESSALASLGHSPAPPPHHEDPLPPNLTSATGAKISHSASSSRTSVLSTSSLPSSLTELAGTLGSEPPQDLATEAGLTDRTMGFDGKSGDGEVSARGASGVYNPFDSDGKRTISIHMYINFVLRWCMISNVYMYIMNASFV